MSPSVLDDDDTIPTVDDAFMSAVRAEAHAPATVVAEYGGATTQGHVRADNEDVWGHFHNDVFAVADGMGGYAGGRLAARTAVLALLSTSASRGIADWSATIAQVNNQVRTATRARGFDRAGTALVSVAILGGVASVVSIGDSRVYRQRAGRLSQLTLDHTVRNELQASGIPLDPAGRDRATFNALTRYLGGNRADPDITTLVPFDGDHLLLVTDGVHRQVPPETLALVIEQNTCQNAADRIVALADAAGGRDNATAVVIRMASEDGCTK